MTAEQHETTNAEIDASDEDVQPMRKTPLSEAPTTAHSALQQEVCVMKRETWPVELTSSKSSIAPPLATSPGPSDTYHYDSDDSPLTDDSMFSS